MIQIQTEARDQGTPDAVAESGELGALNWAIVDVCVRTVQVLGVPRSIGEIFGLIFTSSRPVSFDDVVKLLKLSNGTASHGLRYLKRLGAVRTCYVAQERKDFYVVETSLQKMMSSLLSENVISHLGGIAEHLENLRTSALSSETKQEKSLIPCIEQLIGWNQQIRIAVVKGVESLR
ncbi:MAG TPA: hypothetical protein VFG14_03925 [Chthoniobacteraceae bacterium]|nr:hypothetical protein [Chthoniobacteraceae bacterium]